MKMRKILGILLALLMVAGLVPTALAAPGNTRAAVSYVDENGDPQTCADAVSVTAENETWSGWMVVTEDVEMGEFDFEAWEEHRIQVSGDVHLILTDGATLTAYCGISVPEGSSLTIYGQTEGTGKLIAGEEDSFIFGSAGIGADSNESGGAIVINGGDITAIGGDGGAGIGAGQFSSVESITINGGKVYAQGCGDCGDGIGTGDSCNDSTIITINGGEITAVGGGSGAGIGCFAAIADFVDGVVTINGGTVTASGGTSDGGVGGAGIGGNWVNNHPGTIIINGGTVTATGGNGTNANCGGAGIGGASSGYGGSITISGGVVNATGGLNGGSGIGPGAMSYTYPGDYGTISITGGQVTATSADANGIGFSGTFTSNGGDPIPVETATTLGWTEQADFILSTSYAGSVTLDKDFAVDGSDETFEAGAVEDNSVLAGKKLIPLQQEPAEGYHIIVTDYTKGAATTSIVADQTYSGEVTFTVTCDKACVVAIDNGEDSFTRLTCTTTDSGEHQFTVTVSGADVTIAIALKGDANLDGAVRSNDATNAKQAAAGAKTLTGLKLMTVDSNDDGIVRSNEATKVAQVAADASTYTW